MKLQGLIVKPDLIIEVPEHWDLDLEDGFHLQMIDGAMHVGTAFRGGDIKVEIGPTTSLGTELDTCKEELAKLRRIRRMDLELTKDIVADARLLAEMVLSGEYSVNDERLRDAARDVLDGGDHPKNPGECALSSACVAAKIAETAPKKFQEAIEMLEKASSCIHDMCPDVQMDVDDWLKANR